LSINENPLYACSTSEVSKKGRNERQKVRVIAPKRYEGAMPTEYFPESLPFLRTRLVEQQRRVHVMALEKTFVRDGQRRIIGSLTTGYTGAFDTLVRDEQNHIVGRTSERFQTTRDEHGNLISINTADPGLLIGKRK
jgi:YD repeat-containing protein